MEIELLFVTHVHTINSLAVLTRRQRQKVSLLKDDSGLIVEGIGDNSLSSDPEVHQQYLWHRYQNTRLMTSVQHQQMGLSV